jgi:hypothetical protein
MHMLDQPRVRCLQIKHSLHDIFMEVWLRRLDIIISEHFKALWSCFSLILYYAGLTSRRPRKAHQTLTNSHRDVAFEESWGRVQSDTVTQLSRCFSIICPTSREAWPRAEYNLARKEDCSRSQFLLRYLHYFYLSRSLKSSSAFLITPSQSVSCPCQSVGRASTP